MAEKDLWPETRQEAGPPRMIDPLDALKSLQSELDARNPFIKPVRCQRDARLFYLIDEPDDGVLRLSYLRKKAAVVTVLIQFIQAEPYEGLPCYSIGYAVPEIYRGRGWAKAAVLAALEEFKYFSRGRLSRFYVEAVVGVDNIASRRIAAAALGDNPKADTDSFSGLPALQYVRLIE